jgi:iron(III) transport system permease protein
VSVLATALAFGLALPILAVAAAWAQLFNGFGTGSAASWQTLAHQFNTVLPAYAGTSLALALGVGVGVAVLGSATAVAVTLFDFPGRRTFEWALLLPLAMPAYVMAFAYTDWLDFSGVVQTTLRQWLGVQGRVLPDVRSLPGAILLFTLVLYPYVYLLARAALAERAASYMEAARMLGASTRRRVLKVALPLARPAIAAGVALALMETLADYGASAYFGLNTFTVGIYRAWLSMNDAIAAFQLATALLLVVAVLIKLERRAQAKLRFASNRAGRADAASAQPIRLHGRRLVAAWLVCGLPVLLGFVVPALGLLKLLHTAATTPGGDSGVAGIPWDRFAGWAASSFGLATLAAVLAVGLALLFGFARRDQPAALPLRVGVGVASLGYAMPGAVVALGVLAPLAWWQARFPQWGLSGLVVGTVAGLVYAYLVRFTAVALQSVQAGYARVPTSMDESTRMLGAGRWRLLSRVHLPLLSKPLLAGGLLVFVDVMKELPATFALRPFNHDTLAVVAFQFARDERLAEAALPALAIVAVGLLPVVLLSRTLRTSS